MSGPVITLTTDWGQKDHYAGAVKGRLISSCPDARIVDITHDVRTFDIAEAAFILRQAYPNFPAGTIHIIGLDTVASLKTPHCAAKYRDHYFIGADNGIFSLLFGKEEAEVVEMEVHQASDYFTFSTRDAFVEAAAMITSGKSLKEIGPPRQELTQKYSLQPIVTDDNIQGQVIMVDSFRNVITNISEETFKAVRKSREFTIEFSADYEIKTIHTSYDDVRHYKLVALFGSTGYLEIALNRSNAAELLGLQPGDTINIHFRE